MTRANRTVLVALLTGGLAMPSVAQTVLQKAQRDDIAIVADDDPDMAEAIRKARATLGKFLALALSPHPSITSLAVKVAVRKNNQTELFWITGFERKDGRFVGRISNTPRLIKNIREGDVIAFEEKEIVDWLYREDGKMKGNYTACALIKREPKRDRAAFMKYYGLDCEL